MALVAWHDVQAVKKKQFKPPTLNVLNVSSWQIIQNYSIIKTFSLPAEASVGRLRRLADCDGRVVWLLVLNLVCVVWLGLRSNVFSLNTCGEEYRRITPTTWLQNWRTINLFAHQKTLYIPWLPTLRKTGYQFSNCPKFHLSPTLMSPRLSQMFTSKKYLKNTSWIRHTVDPPSSRGYSLLRIGSDPGIRSVEYFPQI